MLKEITERLLTLNPGDSGILITDKELTALNIPDVPDFDTRARAEWLKKQLPFTYSLKEGVNTSGWIYSRS